MPVIYKFDRYALERLRAVPPTIAPVRVAPRPSTVRPSGAAESFAAYVTHVAHDGADPRGRAIAAVRRDGGCNAETLPALLVWAAANGHDPLAMRALWAGYQSWKKSKLRARRLREAGAP